jgi:hypothetical protein
MRLIEKLRQDFQMKLTLNTVAYATGGLWGGGGDALVLNS